MYRRPRCVCGRFALNGEGLAAGHPVRDRLLVDPAAVARDREQGAQDDRRALGERLGRLHGFIDQVALFDQWLVGGQRVAAGGERRGHRRGAVGRDCGPGVGQRPLLVAENLLADPLGVLVRPQPGEARRRARLDPRAAGLAS
jgi:hypothetical protein